MNPSFDDRAPRADDRAPRPDPPRHATVVSVSVTSEVALGAAEAAELVGVTVERLARLARLGLIDPEVSGAERYSAAAVHRLTRMMRLRRELGVNLAGATVVLDLLDRLERLEAELVRLRAGGRPTP